MQSVLNQINSVPGVVGSMVFDEEGRLSAQLFPPLYDAAMLQEAASSLADSTLGLQGATGSVELIDLRYSDARIVVRPMPQSFLLLLCTKAINMQLLSISLNVAIKKLERLIAAHRAEPAAPSVSPAAAQDRSAVVSFPVGSPAAGGKFVPAAPPQASAAGVSLTVQAMKNTANTYWDNMVDMVSLNRATSVFISDHFKTGSFKKLVLTNPANGRKKKFPVLIIKDDAEHLFDGKAVVSLTSMEYLGVDSSDPVIVSIEVGGGIFGWEGI